MPMVAQDKTICKCGPFTGEFGSQREEHLHAHCASCAGVIYAEGGGGDDGKGFGGWEDGAQCQRCGEIVHNSFECRFYGHCTTCFKEQQSAVDAILEGRIKEAIIDVQDCLAKAKSEDPEELLKLMNVSRDLVIEAINLHREIYARTRDLKPGPLFAGGCGP